MYIKDKGKMQIKISDTLIKLIYLRIKTIIVDLSFYRIMIIEIRDKLIKWIFFKNHFMKLLKLKFL